MISTGFPEAPPRNNVQPELRSLWSAIAGGGFKLHYVDANGVRTRSMVAGDGQQSLVFLHGIAGHLEAYMRNILPHSNTGLRVYAIDMLGHGYTDKPRRNYEIDDYVEHLKDFLDAAGIRKAHISGESLGGWVAARFAARFPERVDRLVLNTAGGLIADPRVMERLRTLSLNAVRSPEKDAVRKRLEFLMADPSVVTDDLVEARYAIYKLPGMLGAMESIMCLQDMDIRMRNLLTEEELSSITARTLVLWTTHDPTASVEVGRRLAAMIPGAEFVVMKDCGHWPQYEDAETFNRIHLDFLTK